MLYTHQNVNNTMHSSKPNTHAMGREPSTYSHGGRAPEVTDVTRNLCACHSNTFKQLFRSYAGLRQIYNCQMGNEASKCALWGGHHQCMYVCTCMYAVCRNRVTLKNAIIVRPTHTLRVGSPGILCESVHMCLSLYSWMWRTQSRSLKKTVL